MTAPVPTTPEEEASVADLGMEHYTCRRLYTIWARALGDRALRIRTTLAAPLGTQGSGQGCVWGGVAIEPTNALRLVDRGPPADDAVAAHEVILEHTALERQTRGLRKLETPVV
jgi:hypothetical protein